MPAHDLEQIERLLYDEADCLDRADLDSWFELYSDDSDYWMPVDPDQTNPHNHISLFYDNRLMMEIRRRNFGHAFAASMEYTVRCSHIISNIRLVEHDDASGDCQVTSNFQAVIYYKELHLYAGKYTHHLVLIEGQYRIQHKRVDLINCDAEHGNLVIYL
ncbi:MAG: 3-phenylpropionate/cinnamic acid dioxygenase small subunit [Gammaproteobacteria bacterium]|jgi:3-phenylpropionate/cinnamic acid dioxygenase small subunit